MKRIISVDSQILNTIPCPTKTKLAFIDNIAPPEKAEPLEKGDLLHKLLDLFDSMIVYSREEWIEKRGYEEFAPIIEWSDNLEKKLAICARFGELQAAKMDVGIETAEEVIFQFQEYERFYEKDNWTPLAIEEAGVIELYEDDELKILYQFRIDKIARLEPQGLIMPWDHKSASRRSIPSSLSNQFMGYCAALKMNSILIDKIGFQKTLKPAERFQRTILNYSEARLEEWKKNAIFWIRWWDQCVQTGIFPRNYSMCDKYSGCIFKGICESDPESRDWKVARDYKQIEKWDVGGVLK